MKLFSLLPLTIVGLALLAIPLGPPLAAQDEQEPADVEIVPESAKDAEPTDTRDKPDVAALIAQQASAFRTGQERSSLSTNEALTATAKKFAHYMARTHRYGHGADGRTPAERTEAEGYDYCIVRENIAYQFSSREVSVEELAQRNSTGWEESPEHRENLLDPDVTEIGVGVAQSVDTGYYFAVQLLGRPKSAAIRFSIANQADTAVKYEVDDKPYELSPRQIRTHTRCRPPELVMHWAEDSERKPETVRPGDGERLAIVRPNGGELKMQKDAGSR